MLHGALYGNNNVMNTIASIVMLSFLEDMCDIVWIIMLITFKCLLFIFTVCNVCLSV